MIQLIVDVYNSRIDRNGNTYWAYVVTDVRSGKTVNGKLGGSARGNAVGIVRELGYEWDEIHSSEHELPIREFDRLVKNWPYRDSADAVARAFAGEGVTTPRARAAVAEESHSTSARRRENYEYRWRKDGPHVYTVWLVSRLTGDVKDMVSEHATERGAVAATRKLNARNE